VPKEDSVRGSSAVLRREDQDLPAHLGLVRRAVEREKPLLVKGEDGGRLPQCRQKDFHQHVGVGTDEHEVMVVVGLEIPEADLGRLITMDGDEGRREGIDLPEAGDRCPIVVASAYCPSRVLKNW
jgi:hypothetical protein